MRLLTDHIVERDDAPQVKIMVLDGPGAGGVSYDYLVKWDDGDDDDQPDCSSGEILIAFQNGPIKEFGINGITHEALLAIVIDRLRSFQIGDFACIENAEALHGCELALMFLKKRTHSRIARGVEGKTEK